MPKTVKVKCPKCHGSGLTELAAYLAETLSAVRKDGSTAKEVASWMATTVPAATNRLTALVQFGLLSRERGPSAYIFRRVS